ncbi:nucleoside recognition domain-containing protein [Paracoccus sp. S1E-3]|uniref:nucleoside recognition domain-containing protein n=1 Tax=Paracoccus sp. S1E-3 TaxID=2756130 RepID=UPI0015EEB9F4|nr:nucleoside recognition domain-containing protein [Paracoccus sp. S1E-3]MBA4490087.1 nucleoside recognition protein [Paracoccus sp. S1E-3]
MSHPILDKTRLTLLLYWELARIIIPVTIATEILSRLGLIAAVAPALAPVMALFGLPPELGLPWLTGMLVGIWAAVPMVFVLLPMGALSGADITVFSALLLFAHALPIEQKIIQRAGPGLIVTTLLRLGGGMLYAFLLHQVLTATGWLAGPMQPAWIPMAADGGWPGFFIGLGKTMAMMLAMLLALSWGMEILRVTGLMAWLMRLLAPVLRLAGIRGEAAELTSVGLFLGVSYGGGLLIREARSGRVSPRQVFISCVFMGFAHSVIEDTAIVMSVGANIWGVLAGRVVFAIAATALIAQVLRTIPDERFLRWGFRPAPR